MVISTVFIVVFASILSLLGTMIGASLGVILKNPSKKVIGNLNGFAAGLMFVIVVFDLIPESIKKINFFYTIVFAVIGGFIILELDFLTGNNSIFKSSHSKVAFLASIGLMLHNFPEGIIMGAGFLANANLGIKMSILIAIHDIPEGIAIAAPLMALNIKPHKIILYSFIVAFPTVIGSLVGMYVGNLSEILLGVCLSIASGIMLYVVFIQMIKEAFNLWKGVSVIFSIIFGCVLGLVITNVL